MILYQNNMYKVFHRYGSTSYKVINRITNVVEDETHKLPTAISSAIALQEALERLVKYQEKQPEVATDEQIASN